MVKIEPYPLRLFLYKRTVPARAAAFIQSSKSNQEKGKSPGKAIPAIENTKAGLGAAPQEACRKKKKTRSCARVLPLKSGGSLPSDAAWLARAAWALYLYEN